jgi:hypothetical protein
MTSHSIHHTQHIMAVLLFPPVNLTTLGILKFLIMEPGFHMFPLRPISIEFLQTPSQQKHF